MISNRSRTYCIRAGTVIAGGAIALSGVGKFHGNFWQPLFIQWGYSPWFSHIVGAAEIIAGVLFFFSALAPYAGFVLVTIMAGAAYTLRVHPTPVMGSWIRPLVYLSIIIAVCALRLTDPLRKSPAYRR